VFRFERGACLKTECSEINVPRPNTDEVINLRWKIE
jgi:hypothetical protein